MTRVVKKVTIENHDSITIKASVGAFKVLTVHEYDGDPTIWFETLEKPVIPIDVTFKIIQTGDEVPDHSTYVGTTHTSWGNVLHVYQHPNI